MMDDREQKAAFAAFLFENPADRLGAAMRLHPNESDRGLASWIAMNWPDDEFVKRELERLKAEHKPEIGADLAELLEMYTDIIRHPHAQHKDKIAAGKMLAELKGIGKNNGDIETDKKKPKMPVYKIVEA